MAQDEAIRCRKQALECREQAFKAVDARDQQKMLRIAAEWFQRASSEEKQPQQ